MSLRSKLVLLLAVLVAVFALSQLVIERVVIYASFEQLETRQARRDLQRVLEALQNEIGHLDGLCHDWAAWDDTYAYVEDGNPAYEAANLTNTTLVNDRLAIVYVVDLAGRVRARVLREPDAGSAALDLAEFPSDVRSPSHPLHCVDDEGARIAGIYLTSAGPMLVSSRPILKSSNAGPIRGSLLMGRLLDAPHLEELAHQTKVRFQIEEATGDAARDTRLARIALALETSPDGVVEPIDASTNEVSGIVRDFQGHPALLVRAEVPRDVTEEGGRALTFAILSTIGAGVLILLAVLVLLQRSVVGPLSALTAHAVAIGQRGDLAARTRSTRRDEIGVLAREIDAMVEKLARSHEELVSTARLAGMSEVATGVLHDVGNGLTSVNVSAEIVKQRLASLPVSDLSRMSAQIQAHAADLGEFLTRDPKGSKYPAYLALLSTHLSKDVESIGRETDALFEGLDHVKSLVKAQQDLAGNSEASEPVDPAREFESALRISRANEDGALAIERDFRGPRSIVVQRHRLLQILVNLLKNARRAVDDRAGVAGRIVISVETASDGRHVRFSVRDNGVGIAPEHQVSIFGHGYTTKPDGHGFGLHSAANTARDMGGKLAVESAGPGLGACFVLELPLTERTADAA